MDRHGHLYVAGNTSGTLAGTNAGSDDVLLGKLDLAGKVLWLEQFGSPGNDEASSISVDGSGDIYISGLTSDSLFGLPSTGRDAFLLKFSQPVPEPTSGLLACVAGLALFSLSRSRA